MRYSEIAPLPATPQEAKNALLDIIAVYSGNNRDEIPLNVIMKTLHRQNFDFDRRLIIDMLKDEPSIKRISNDVVYLATEPEEDVVSPDEADKSKEKVKQMAKKTLKKTIGG